MLSAIVFMMSQNLAFIIGLINVTYKKQTD
jgi:hypothetical protein